MEKILSFFRELDSLKIILALSLVLVFFLVYYINKKKINEITKGMIYLLLGILVISSLVITSSTENGTALKTRGEIHTKKSKINTFTLFSAGETIFFDFGKRIDDNYSHHRKVSFPCKFNGKKLTFKVVWYPSGNTELIDSRVNKTITTRSFNDTGCYITPKKRCKIKIKY